LDEADLNQTEELNLQAQLKQLKRENRKLSREITHLQNALTQEKLASTTILNQQKASTFIQRERERYLALLLANSPSIIFFLNHIGRVEFCTDYFVTKADFKDEAEVQGHTLTEILAAFLDHDSHQKLLEYRSRIIRTSTPISFDMTFRFNKDDAAEDFAGLMVPMKDERLDSNGIMLMFHDVTDLKRSREEALAASRAKSDFLSTMSHEIRTPMNAIIGMTSIGINEKSPERKDYAFGKIENASTHLLGVINDILDISKIESGKMELSNINFNFSEMLDRVMTVISVKMKDSHHHFSVEIDPNIPDNLYGDDQRLAQVITNILSNATKFTPQDGCIEFNATLLELQNDQCKIQMQVKDSGIGISKQEQKKLFNLFQQAEVGTSRKYGGSGLGLAISKRILELMNGDIWVESATGKGSCFFFTAVLKVPQQASAALPITPASTLKAVSAPADFSKYVLLLVDDIDINLEIVIALLEPTNITIDTAKSGKKAFDAFVTNPDRYNLILMDVQMPEVDGLQATQMIRALNTPQATAIPIIAMTANVFKEDIERCIKAGMNDHLGKPIIMADVLNKLAFYLKS